MIRELLERPLVVADPFEPLDAIVVLGAPLRRDGALTRLVRERVAAAIDLYQRGGAPSVVVTGGVTNGAPRAEADAMAEALAAHGIRALVEREARTTRDNARLTAALLLPHARRVWLVTQPFHGRRARQMFRRAGFDAHVWHLANSRVRLKWLVREYAALTWQALRSRA